MKFSNAIVGVFLVAAAATALPDCTDNCAIDVGKPVCAENGQELKLFDNDCYLRLQNCRYNNQWQKTRLALCLERSEDFSCIKPCTKDLKPVCGFDGKQHEIFDNYCMMMNKKCLDGHKWAPSLMTECLKRLEPIDNEDRSSRCSREFKPVCGFDGENYVMFNNECLMKNTGDGHKFSPANMIDCLKRTQVTNKDCFVPCTRKYKPICGFDGDHHKIFNNECLMKNQFCIDGHKFAQVEMIGCLVRTVESKNNCFKRCSKNIAPVCGFDGTNHQIFNSECNMGNQECIDFHKWSKSPMIDCLKRLNAEEPFNKCRVPCTREYIPVCGSDGNNHYKIFNNNCELKNQHCEDGHNWLTTRMELCIPEKKIVERIDEECPVACVEVYTPVCAFDGESHKLFSNECMFKAANCISTRKWQLTNLDDCSHIIFS